MMSYIVDGCNVFIDSTDDFLQYLIPPFYLVGSVHQPLDRTTSIT